MVPNTLALMLVDIQNSFLHPSGGNYFASSKQAVSCMRALLDRARERNLPIIFVAERHRPNIDDFESKKLPVHCISGEFDAQLYAGFAPSGEREFLLEKRRMSAFHGTDLDLLLRETGVKRLLICGVKTNVCIRATVQDAFSFGYECYVPRDAVASNRAHLHDATLEDIERYLGWVTTTAGAMEIIS